MPRCTRQGCGQEFTGDSADPCTYHPGAPVFHEGLKSWSCCADVNKPVLDFEEFMQIIGCAQMDHHTSAAQTVGPPRASSTTSFTVSGSSSGTEAYTISGTKTIKSSSPPAFTPEPLVEEDDDVSVAVKPGTLCRRKGCGTAFVSNEINRQGDAEGVTCTYHPAPPIFREGSKGYLCCKRRVLEFDEFLKIQGCKTGRHVFAPIAIASVAEEMTACRVDHYQTVDKVCVSIFARQVDKERSSVKFDETQVTIDLYFSGSKRFLRVLDLFGPIDPSNSTFQFFGAKVELHLQKQGTRSWTVLEKTTRNLGNISLTFGVGGRTGTVGGKELVLDESNRLRR